MTVDFLTCGLCQTEFPLAQIVAFMQHKKYDCDTTVAPDGLLREVEKLQKYSCVSCPEKFAAAVTLLQHVQLVHQIKLFIEEVYNCRSDARRDASLPLADGYKSGISPEGPLGTTHTVVLAAGAPNRNAESDGVAAGTSVAGATTDVPLKKCCASVVPKKRKRHIETKHSYTGSGNSATAKGKWHSVSSTASACSANNDDDDSDTIYIDVNPSTERGNRGQTDSRSSASALILHHGNTYSIPSSSALPYVGITYGNRQAAESSFTVSPDQDGSGGDPPFSRPSSPHQSCGDAASSVMASAKQPHINRIFGKRHEDDGTEEDIGDNTDSSCSGARKRQKTSRGDRQRNLVKPYKCDLCEHSFNQRIHLQKHLSKHTGVKPFKCEQCDYATVERSHLKVHIRIHTGEKPYKCTHCEYATAQNSTLKIHLKRHHGGGLVLECSRCGKSFPEKKQFNAHQQEHVASEDTKAVNVSAMEHEAVLPAPCQLQHPGDEVKLADEARLAGISHCSAEPPPPDDIQHASKRM